MICVLVFSLTFVVSAKTTEITTVGTTISFNNYPSIDMNGRTNYVIYKEGWRNNRIELALYNTDSSGPLILRSGWTLGFDDTSLYKDDEKYYLDSSSNKWVKFENGYTYVSNHCSEVILSSRDVYDINGNLVLAGSWNQTTGTLTPYTINGENTGRTISTTVQGPSKPFKIELEDGFKFTAPDNVPFIGGGEIKIDLSFVPISAKVEGDKLYVGIGIKDMAEKDLDKNTWCSFKNYCNGYADKVEDWKQLRDLTKKFGGCGASKVGFGKSLDVDFYGYLEATIKNDGSLNVTGTMAKLTINGSVSKEFQAFAGPIPMVFKIKAAIGIDDELSLSIDGGSVKIANELTITLPDLTASAGFGLAYVADISVYGKLTNKVKSYDLFRRVTASLEGELGISGKFLMFSGKIPAYKFKEPWVYYDSDRKSSSSIAATGSSAGIAWDDICYSIDRSYITKQSEWLGSTANDKIDIAATGAGYSYDFYDYPLQTDIYNNAAPKLIRTGEDIILIWTGDDLTRTTGNETVACYSIFDYDNYTFGSPVAIEDNGTADFYPEIATDGENTYVAWVDANAVFDENVSLEEMAAACEIKVAKFNPETKTFENPIQLTDNDTVDIKPSVAVKDGKAVIAWKNNSANQLIEINGNNSIYYAEEQDNGTYSQKTIYSTEKAVYELITDGQKTIISVDGDNNYETADDIEIFVISSDGVVTQLTDNEEHEYNLAFSEINGTQCLTYESNGVIYGTYDMTEIVALTDEDTTILGEYQFVSNGNTTKLYSVETSDDSAELYAYSQNENGLWSDSIRFVGYGGYIRNASYIVDDTGEIMTVFLRTNATITDDDVIENTDLCCGYMFDHPYITIDDITYSYEDVNPGQDLDVTLSLSNTGTIGETQLRAYVFDSKWNNILEETIDIDLNSGQNGEAVIHVPIDSSVQSKVEKYTVTLRGTDGWVYDDDTFSVGYTNLQLTTDMGKENGYPGIIVNVYNKGYISTEASLVVKPSEDSDIVLDNFYLGEIDANNELKYFIEYDKIQAYQESTDALYFELVSYKDEEILTDNNDTVYIANIQYIAPVLGDVDGDGNASVIDATYILRYNVNMQIPIDEYIMLLCGDVDGDGEVTVIDATFILRYEVMMNTPYSIGEPIA